MVVWDSELDMRHRPFSTVCQAAPSVIITGGGAAGLTAAYFAALQGAEVTVLERTREAGKKILISGGARCNVLPMEVDVQRDFVTESSPSALRAIFASWSLEDCKHWLEDNIGLALATEQENMKYFPASNSSREVRDRLVAACTSRGVRILCKASVEGLSRQPGGGWRCSLADGSHHDADSIVVATGGLSFPKMGTDGTGHRIVGALGHSLKPVYPALTPLKGRHPAGSQLAGLSLYDVDLQCSAAAAAAKGKKKGQRAQRSAFLFTHRGYSGPSVLDLSHSVTRALERGTPLPRLSANWLGDSRADWDARLAAGPGSSSVPSLLRKHGVPQRLAEALCAEAGVSDRRVAELRKTERAALLESLTEYPLDYDGHEGYAKAEVTGGGIPLSEVDCSTMESRVLPGVHLCGEILDVFGRIGGFNFYWAWLTGRLAGMHAVRSVDQ
ncbi:HI0933-like protein [Coccomyxa subellipsoidea C-169]|uniref:HI0933-like protein n=1 Tax=Coccomyxa subellipsoidea (strain C-169) TaxID=574566 RepID=I0YY21_COCSC|nr:HI0933-like protein [Coccomyxa subellipsoidea C-169]EIE23290.1 HI0933-like protein [Coccomyxa subellipsoidea C-169]|eukprot:XP_005647834.1 HI0933-like protein [Coccomyxa subellipsoidea C-169]